MPEIYQDWTPVVLTKSKSKPKLKNVDSIGNGSAKKIYNNDGNNTCDNDEPDIKPKIVSKEYGIKMQQYRQAFNKSQQDMANALSIPINTIRDYERGTAIYNANITTKINRYLKMPK